MKGVRSVLAAAGRLAAAGVSRAAKKVYEVADRLSR
jgi:hypothetical protein